MAVRSVVTWRNRIRQSLEIERLVDLESRTDEDPERPYWLYEEFERLHVEFAQQAMLMLPERDLEQLGVAGITGATFANNAPRPQGLYRVVAASIGTTGQVGYPAVGPVPPTDFYQLQGGATHVFAFIDDKIVFNGDFLNLLYVEEPIKEILEADYLVLPAAATLEMAIEFVHQHLTAADWLPAGRV